MDRVFQNRAEAGDLLAAALAPYKADEPVILALPRGGVPVAARIAMALDAPLDLLLVKKVGAPGQPELAVAAVVDGTMSLLVVNEAVADSVRLPPGYLTEARAEKLKEIERQRAAYLGERPRAALAGRTVILVDDGIATGTSMRAALQAVRAKDAGKIVLAVPAAPTDGIRTLEDQCDAVHCLVEADDFRATSLFYRDFHQVEDAEVIRLLAATKAPDPAD